MRLLGGAGACSRRVGLVQVVLDVDAHARAGAPSETPPASGLRRPLLAAAVTTMMVTAVSHLAPERYAATLVGVVFLASTWWLVLRHEALTVQSYGLSLGGMLEPAPLIRAGSCGTRWSP